MSEKTMFKLQLPTDPFWVKNVVESNIEEILVDHAYCEQKAATNAITLIIQNPNISELVQEMAELVKEEMDHFKRVHDIILKRGYVLGLERKDNYVNELMKFLKRGGGEAKRTESMVDRLLLAAMIEARSCERFKVLSEYVDDKELADFYHELMVSEANHYTLFIGLARKYGIGIDVEKRWQEWLTYEGEVIKNYGKGETIHG
ncbi:MAG: tRNA-(ms[2]io[6]A)-hydroxylase [Bacteroidetes bacterium]|nr:tRNA-(ms[2]io[6]A)-hydroxylase [Bacteroidota bacterium]MBU1374200.1 tRNA-(ms[2]io[6]A)-hydroxylase [Bacteroidota bacterium]MBU1485911.1 tRNA-(ms[2]io[6]A)-hydroxylase [Bacteroidota bacterium]MBU1760035.1 tRNA-(ms[2]io[6]A)-hydroxylase [Bacteroidota bacterium]MBU2046582.1 tRNA-(ms[2]io[6]A)-hydroxylase [Bacteroidota bacterium]